ncbi:DUF1612 domain-containing protein [Pelagibius sp.]|uniref:DUF1612 domain-containing protein n=1 Tax=Pelagibius sp. TaxID=1931238 RepID=UPI003B504AAF
MQATRQAATVNGNALTHELQYERKLRGPERSGRRYALGLPWESFARAWSLAEDRLARLEQQLLSSDLRHSWICRADFKEVSALVALDGGAVALEDLALVDAQSQPNRPAAAWTKAKALLSLRRQIGRAGPAKTLTAENLLALEHRLTAILDGGNETTEVLEEPHSAASMERLRRWLDVVGELESTPAVPAAAMALRVWQRIKPLDRHCTEIGLLLAPLLLWHWGKTKGMTVCLAAGLQEARRSLDSEAPLDAWIRQFCEAVQVAANLGLDEHHRIARGRARLVELLTRHGAGSRLPRLAWLFLNYPAISTGFIKRRLELTAQGSNWLLQELIGEGIVQEVTGRPKNRAYSLAV